MSTGHLAWLDSDGTTIWSRDTSLQGSSVIALISSVYERDPRWARRIIRHRIRTTEPLSESSWGTVKVAARRVDYSCPRPSGLEGAGVELVPAETSADECLSKWVRAWTEGRRFSAADEIWPFLDQLTREAQQVQPRIVALPVSAILLDADGAVLSWGVNSAWDFRTQHAETNLIRRWNRLGSPGGAASLWVTRKPCKMCSGWIWDALLTPGAVAIRYRDPDDGPLARTTVLDPGTFERRRAEAALKMEVASASG
jgi:tRNA(Arg) A34 adenosine deaminase TadA